MSLATTAPRLVARFLTLSAALIAALVLTSCASGAEIRYYQLAPPPPPSGNARGTAVLSVDQFLGDAAFEDTRIVYRLSPYRLDYYYYHRWTSPPGLLVADYLRLAYERTGLFRTVISGFSPESSVTLNGRVVAFEEVDEDDLWFARVVLDLHLRSAQTGRILWSRTITEVEPVDERNPEGVARAMSRAMQRVVAQTAPTFAQIAENIHGRSTGSFGD